MCDEGRGGKTNFLATNQFVFFIILNLFMLAEIAWRDDKLYDVTWRGRERNGSVRDGTKDLK